MTSFQLKTGLIIFTLSYMVKTAWREQFLVRLLAILLLIETTSIALHIAFEVSFFFTLFQVSIMCFVFFLNMKLNQWATGGVNQNSLLYKISTWSVLILGFFIGYAISDIL